MKLAKWKNYAPSALLSYGGQPTWAVGPGLYISRLQRFAKLP
ncbi:MAG: hypothetical protein AABM67_06070 [Acidobacteriota bacterium]